MYATDFAKGGNCNRASLPGKNHLVSSNLTDGKDDTSWALSNDAKTGEFTVDLGQKRRFDVVELKKKILLKQRISGFAEVESTVAGFRMAVKVRLLVIVVSSKVNLLKHKRFVHYHEFATSNSFILDKLLFIRHQVQYRKTDGYPLG